MSDSEHNEPNVNVPELDLSNAELNAANSLLAQTNQSVFLTGKAGTGKSTFLRYVQATTKKKFVVLAPTGIAAVNVGGQTLHSFFKIPLKPLLPDDADFAVGRLRQRLKYSKSFIKLLLKLDLIIIDEISMVRADVIDFIDRVLRVYTGNMRQPFGGKQMLFVGDVFQLEPVVTGNDRDVLSRCYSSFYFFNANVFREMNLVPIELNKVYRQEEQSFISLLDHIRLGQATQADLSLLNTRYNPAASNSFDKDEFTMTIASRREMVDSINDRHLNALPAPIITFQGQIIDDFPSNALPTDLNLELKVGAQVVFVKNDPERRWVNGTVAVIEKCLPDCVTVRTEDGEEHEVTPERWSNVKYTYNEKTRKVDEIELGSFIQLPLKLAWALTIHKSQGLTFANVIIDMGRGAFAGGQTYVALSRCRSLEGITLLNPITGRDIYVRPEVARFASTYNNPKLIESAIENSRADALFRSAAKACDDGRFSDAVMAYSEALALKPSVMDSPAVKRLVAIKSLKLKALQQEIGALKTKLVEDRKCFERIADGYVKLANELGNEGWEAESALVQYDKALEIAPDYGPAVYGKAELLAKTGQTDEAHRLFGRFTRIDKENAWKGFVGMGDISANEGDDFNAISNYLHAHQAASFREEPVRRLIESYRRIQDFDSANFYKSKLSKLRARKK